MMSQPVKQLFNPTVILNNLDTIDASLVIHEDSISDNTSSITDLTTTVSGNTSSITDLTTTVSGNTSSITDLTTTVSGNTSSITDLTTTVSGNTSSITDLSTTVSGNTSSITDLTTTVSRNTSSITDLTTTVSGNTSSITDLTTTVSGNTSSITDLTTTVLGITSSITNLVTAVAPNLQEYKVELVDSYNDGWHGAYLEIKNIDSGSIHNIEFPYNWTVENNVNNRLIRNIWLPDGNYEVMVRNIGIYEREISWNISIIRPVLSSNFQSYQTMIAGKAYNDKYSIVLPPTNSGPTVSNTVEDGIQLKKYIFNIRALSTIGSFRGKIIIRDLISSQGASFEEYDRYEIEISPAVFAVSKEFANIIIFLKDSDYSIEFSGIDYDSTQNPNELYYLDILNDDESITIENILIYNTDANNNYILSLPNMDITIPDFDIQPTPTVEGPDNILEFDVAFHIVREDNNTWTDANNIQLQQQIDILNDCYTTTSKSMLWDDNLPDDEQNVLASKGGTQMKIKFNLKKSDSSGDNNYFSLITPDSNDWDPEWLNSGNIVTANSIYGHNFNPTEMIKTINVWISPSGANSGYAYFPAAVGTSTWLSWIRLDTLPGNENPTGGGARGGGKTLVHEIGHNFGLDHTFNPDVAVNGSIYNDTSYHSEPNYGSYIDEEGNPYPNDSTNIPDTNPLIGRDPVYNYMNYVNDDSMFRFTDDQLYLMWSNIETYLSELWNASQNDNINRHESINVFTSKKILSRINKKHLNDVIENSNIFKIHEDKCNKRCGCKMSPFAIDKNLLSKQPQIIRQYFYLNNLVKNKAFDYKPKNLKMIRKEK